MTKSANGAQGKAETVAGGGRINFRASATIQKRLGEELIKDPLTAFFELIKNSYDADAKKVIVEFNKTESDDGFIIVHDDGSGMKLEDIRDKWARAGGENKVRSSYTPILNRRCLGAKGIGRFSAAKLGRCLKLTTRARSEDEQVVVKVDFDEFTDDRNFDEMGADYKCGKPRHGFDHGTILEMSGLTSRWGRKEVRKIKEQLSRLVDPEHGAGFEIQIICKAFPELEGTLANPIVGKESHLVEFSIDKDGRFTRKIASQGLVVENKREKLPAPTFGPINGVFRYFKDGLKARERNLGEDTDEWHMGVKVTRDGFRVRPYGERGDDWLGVRARRARSHEGLHPDYLTGTVSISATSNPRLKDESNRESGIIENPEFEAFREFVMGQIVVLSDLLAKEKKSETQKAKRETIKTVLDTVVNCLNNEQSDLYKGFVNRVDRARSGTGGVTVYDPDDRIRDEKKAQRKTWHCLDCDEVWRTPEDLKPTKCMEFAVTRQGEYRGKEGCGSTNIEHAKHQPREEGGPNLGSIIAGEYAVVSGKMIHVRVDYDMGARDAEVVLSEREIVINGNHVAFKAAEELDGVAARQLDETAGFVPALTMHISKCVCLAWAELHYKESKGDYVEFKNRYERLQESIYTAVREKLVAKT